MSRLEKYKEEVLLVSFQEYWDAYVKYMCETCSKISTKLNPKAHNIFEKKRVVSEPPIAIPIRVVAGGPPLPSPKKPRTSHIVLEM